MSASGALEIALPEHEKDRTPLGQDGLRNAIF
jgi:hypothetical protein